MAEAAERIAKQGKALHSCNTELKQCKQKQQEPGVAWYNQIPGWAWMTVATGLLATVISGVVLGYRLGRADST